MSLKSALLMKVLVNRFHPGEDENFLKELPPEEIKEVLARSTQSDETPIALNWIRDLISKTHYSWFAPLVLKLPKYLQKLTVFALPENQSSGLQKLLKIESSPVPLTAPLRGFLLGSFYRRWQPREAVPFQYLAPSPLNPLLGFSKAELVELIDFLALYDVADAVRHIVDKNKLTSIYKCLSTKKQQFLRTCLHKKERITAQKLNIDKWDGDPEKFKLIIHRRGIFRLSKALCGQTEGFVWHVVHILDTGRGALVMEQYQKEAVPTVTPVLRQQLLNVIDFLKEKSAA